MKKNKNSVGLSNAIKQPSSHSGIDANSDSSPLSISFEQLLDMPVGKIAENFEGHFNSLAKAHAFFTKNNGVSKILTNQPNSDTPNYAEVLIEEVVNDN